MSANAAKDDGPNVVSIVIDALRAKGYATAAFVINPHLPSKDGFGQGFEVYDDNAEGSPSKKVPLYRRMETAKKLHRKHPALGYLSETE